LITSSKISFATIYISSKNESNAEILTVRLQGQFNVISEFVNRYLVRTMNWDVTQLILVAHASRLGTLDLAVGSPLRLPKLSECLVAVIKAIFFPSRY